MKKVIVKFSIRIIFILNLSEPLFGLDDTNKGQTEMSQLNLDLKTSSNKAEFLFIKDDQITSCMIVQAKAVVP